MKHTLTARELIAALLTLQDLDEPLAAYVEDSDQVLRFSSLAPMDADPDGGNPAATVYLRTGFDTREL